MEPRFAKDVCKKCPAQTPGTPFRQGLAPNCSAKKRPNPVSPLACCKAHMSLWARTPFPPQQVAKLTCHFVLKPRFPLDVVQNSPTNQGSDPVYHKECAKTNAPFQVRTPFRQGRLQK